MKKLLTLAVLLSLSLASCNMFFDEKQAYLNSSKEVACLLMQTNNYDDPALETKGREIFEKNGLDVSSEASMNALDAKYKDDPDVQNAILEALKSCGGDMFKDVSVPETTENTETTIPVELNTSTTEESATETIEEAVSTETPELTD